MLRCVSTRQGVSTEPSRLNLVPFDSKESPSARATVLALTSEFLPFEQS